MASTPVKKKRELQNNKPEKEEGDEKEPKKPGPNAYNFFTAATRPKYKERYPDLPFGDLTKLVANDWKNADVKKKWEKKYGEEMIKWFWAKARYNDSHSGPEAAEAKKEEESENESADEAPVIEEPAKKKPKVETKPSEPKAGEVSRAFKPPQEQKAKDKKIQETAAKEVAAPQPPSDERKKKKKKKKKHPGNIFQQSSQPTQSQSQTVDESD